jgi:thymidylate kinase
MKPRLIICEGADNCGKSTLAKAIANNLNGVYWRLTSGPGLSEHDAMALYQRNALDNAAVNIDLGRTVVLDRHWPSDQVYGTILRGRPSTDALLMEENCDSFDPIYIHCYRYNAVEEHAKCKDPDHPYEDSTYAKVVAAYDRFFDGLGRRQVVVGYPLDNFIDKPGQLDAFIQMIRRIP